MQQALLIALTVVFVVVLLGINIYLLILYCHPDDKGWGSALYCKIIVVFGLTLCQAQALMVPLDVANRSALLTSDVIDMRSFWYFLYIVILFFVVILIPFSMFFYETDEDDTFMKRLLTSFCFTFIAIIVAVMLIFISWAFLKFVFLPVKELTLAADQSVDPTAAITVFSQTAADKEIELQASLAVYIIAIMSFFGWILLVLFGGVGLFALPLDWINEFRHRPKARKSCEMKDTKDNLTQAITSLITEGAELGKIDEECAKNSEGGFFARWKNRRAVENKLTEFKAKYQMLSEEYRIFHLQLEYADSNPVVPWLKLLMGIIFLLTAILWIIQIIFGNIAKSFSNRPLIPFLNEMLIYLQDHNAGFVGTGIFAYFTLYMLWSVQKGNIKFGMMVPCCCRFHPMLENETWMNSFLFNVMLLLIASAGVIQLVISSFPTYTRNTEIFMIFGVQINYMGFYSAFYENNVFPIAFVIWSLLTLIGMLLCSQKPAYMEDIEKIRETKDKYDKQRAQK